MGNASRDEKQNCLGTHLVCFSFYFHDDYLGRWHRMVGACRP
jgi:hypothetical protein